MRRLLYYWFLRRTVLRAVKVASIVGTVLAIINHYDELVSGNYSPRVVRKILLTYLVPYCVSSFSAARAEIEREAQEKLGKTL